MFFSLILLEFLHEGENHGIRCTHDQDKDMFQTQYLRVKKSIHSILSSSENASQPVIVERKPIRIQVDMHFIDGRDERQCYYEGQQISGKNPCFADDVLNESRINSLKGTIENVKEYLESLLLVDPWNEPIQLITVGSDFKFPQDHPRTATGCDLYISFFVRPFGQNSNVMAQAGALNADPDSKRPLHGGVYMNGQKVPNEVEGEFTEGSKFFWVLVHEIGHALGISSSHFHQYHPKGNYTPYENVTCRLNDEETGKSHTFLITPHAHKFAVMQWGVEEFTIGGKSCPSGIEIEDGGGSGTAGSHPECRIAHTDVMVGVTLQEDKGPFQRLTPITASILLDTGNYDINWNKVQPLLWGNKDTIDGNYIKDFVTRPPEYVFPQQYIYRPNKDPSYDYCSFDFKSTGGLWMINRAQQTYYNCSNPSSGSYSNTQAYCKAEKFFNPLLNQYIGGDWSYDFQIVHLPGTESCAKGSACIGGMYFCAEYHIAEDEKSFDLIIPNLWHYGQNTRYTCNESNVGVVVQASIAQSQNSYRLMYLKCPPIEQFIRTVRMFENQPYYTSNPFEAQTSGPDSSKPGGNGLPGGTVAAIVIVVLAIVIAVVITLLCYFKKWLCFKDNGEKSVQDETILV